MDLSPEQTIQYAAIIDSILRVSDLTVISEKKIRKGLEEKVGHDLSSLKHAIKPLIMERFDKFEEANTAVTAAPLVKTMSKVAAPKPKTNGYHNHGSATVKVKAEAGRDVSSGVSYSDEDDDDADFDRDATPPSKKRKREALTATVKPGARAEAESDAQLAQRLQAQEDSRAARSTRGSATKKTAPAKKKRSPKKKSAAKIKSADDSDLDLDSNGEKKEVVRKGGFHKQYALSQPLTQLVGETQLSRPQVVKKIWEHIKANELQDPSDKRQIRCDEVMYQVFKQDKVHMFTMNKILGKQLYPIETE